MAMPPAVALPAPVQTARWILRPAPFLALMRREYGEVCTANFAPLGPVVMTSAPDDIRALFTAPPQDVPTATTRSPLSALVGEHSLLTLNDDEHMRQRKLLLPSFHGDRLRGYAPTIEAAIDRELSTWSPGQTLRTHARMASITLEVILRAVFGVDDVDRYRRLAKATEDLLGLTGRPSAIVTAIVATRTGRLTGSFGRAAAAFDALVYDEIAAHRSHPDLDERADILSLLMGARDEAGQPMTDVELRDELVTLLLAGHETTATSVAWSVERILRTPHVLARLTDDPFDDAYVDAVIAETLRDRPVVPLVGRILRKPLVFSGYDIPAGTFAAANIFNTNHNADRYDDQFVFSPERFLGHKPDTYAWIPFGGGVRRCIGAAFAQLEMRMILQALFSRVQLDVVDPAPEPIRRRNVTLVPQHGATVRVRAVQPSRVRPASPPLAERSTAR